MSKIRIVQNPIDQNLLRRLVGELRAPEQQLAEGQPVRIEDELVIIEESTSPGRTGITVVWDAWSPLEPRERGRLIMEALREERGDEVGSVSLCLGLTHGEYTRIAGRSA